MPAPTCVHGAPIYGRCPPCEEDAERNRHPQRWAPGAPPTLLEVMMAVAPRIDCSNFSTVPSDWEDTVNSYATLTRAMAEAIIAEAAKPVGSAAELLAEQAVLVTSREPKPVIHQIGGLGGQALCGADLGPGGPGMVTCAVCLDIIVRSHDWLRR